MYVAPAAGRLRADRISLDPAPARRSPAPPAPAPGSSRAACRS